MNADATLPEPGPRTAAGGLLTGHEVVDSHLEKVGKVTDVLYDELEQHPRWVIVKTGLLGSEHYVPLANAYVSQEGRLVVPLDKSTIRSAPRAHRDHVLTLGTRKALREHYGHAA